MYHQLIKPIILILSIASPLWIIFRLVLKHYKRKKNEHTLFTEELMLFLFYVYTILVLTVTNFPIPFTQYQFPHEAKINLVPIVNTTRILLSAINAKDNIGIISSLENIIGNILLFIPLGILLPFIWHRTRTLKTILLTAFLFSFLIEFMQLVLRQFGNFRTVDIDDIILNVSGAMLGFYLFRLFHYMKNTHQKAHL